MNQSPEIRTCLKCGNEHPSSSLVDHEYRCPGCDLETAHLDRAPNGAIRGIYSWLRQREEIVHQRYRVKSLLGRGGFAATYLVDDLRLDGKPRALKEIPELLFDTYETNLLSRLDHPSIPDITDQFTEDGLTYLVLKFAGTRTLEGVRKEDGGRIPLNKLVPWMLQLCDVLSYLHRQDPPVIHRDLKPANILLDDSDRITLIDFGIAKIAADGTETRTLARAVTHGFSPPEQVGGTGTDPRSDIYALAATFYSVATGIVPPAAHERLAGKSIVEPAQLIDNFPAALNAAILQALDLNLNNRQSTIEEFGQAFADADDLSTPTRPTGTVFVSEDQMRTTGATLRSGPIHSVKLPTGRDRAGEQKSDRPSWLLLVGTLAAIGSIGGLGFWYWQSKNNSPDLSKPEAETAQQQGKRSKATDEFNAKRTSQPEPVPATEITQPASVSTTQSNLSTTIPPAKSSKASDIFNQYRKKTLESSKPKKIVTTSAAEQQKPVAKSRNSAPVKKSRVRSKPRAKQPAKKKPGLGDLDFGETYR